MEGGIIAFIVALVVIVLANLKGKDEGRREERRGHVEEIEKRNHMQADAELETARNKPIVDRIAAIRDSILRRGKGSGS